MNQQTQVDHEENGEQTPDASVALPTIAIVGRPNVGKSALFNQIVGRRKAIVHEESGVTRDRIVSIADWFGKRFMIIDTGGLGLFKGERSAEKFDGLIREQLCVALDSADQVILVVDVQAGLTPLDEEVGRLLRETEKSVTVAANKSDNADLADQRFEFDKMGFSPVIPISCVQKSNIGELLDSVTEDYPTYGAADSDKELPVLNIAIVGRPNVGKSSIINRLLNEERVIVSDVPGTTRDAIDVPFFINFEGESVPMSLVDTAGIQRKRSIKTAVEFYSFARTQAAIKRSHIVLIVLDAADQLTNLDKKIGREVCDEAKACILLLNKWDIASKDTKQIDLIAEIQDTLPYLAYAPIQTCCAVSGYNFKDILLNIAELYKRLTVTIPTPLVNRVIRDIVARQPPLAKGTGELKVYYSVFVKNNPPTFRLFINKRRNCPRNYLTYLKKQFRRAFDLQGLPIVIQLNEKTRD